jgi:hypothetical protein
VAQLCVAALDKGWAIAGEPRLDLSHACSPECINIYGLVSKYKRESLLLGSKLGLSKSASDGDLDKQIIKVEGNGKQ